MTDDSAPRADLLASYDAAVEALRSDPENVNLRHAAVLLLARGGAVAEARREYVRLGLDAVRDHEDAMALGARLSKDLAFMSTGDARRQYARESAEKYAEAYALRRSFYPGINTATMWLLGGEPDKARTLARSVLDDLAAGKQHSAEDAYYRAASAAEANFLLGRIDEAERALADAFAHDPANYTAHASTLRQLEVLCAAVGLDQGWLDRHRPPPAMMFCGHMFDESAAGVIAPQIATAIAQLKPSAAFGALAAGSDIVIAEAALDRGAELHLVLPMREEDFIARSVVPFGTGWVARYHASKARAATFRFASGESGLGDDAVFAFGAEFAMGLAIRHAEALSTHAHQLAVWDGGRGAGLAGTGADVARWRTTGRPQTIISCTRANTNQRSADAEATAERKLKAMLFADVRGFSRLEESNIRPFVESVLAPVAAALRGVETAPDLIATWGDGIHMVYESVGAAAEAALAAQECFAGIDLAAANLPPYLALRIGGHFGPVAELEDPFLKTRSFYGTHITIAARIEPVAVPGTIYVSEPFAALLALRAPGQYRTEYVGQTELAKGFGTTRLFALRRAEALG